MCLVFELAYSVHIVGQVSSVFFSGRPLQTTKGDKRVHLGMFAKDDEEENRFSKA